MSDPMLAALWLILGSLLALATLLLALALLAHRALRQLARQALPPPRHPGWYYLRPGEPPRGPVELAVLQAMVADGRLGAEALAAAAGSTAWRPLGDLLQPPA
jgi:hypothetical protein